MAEEQVEDSGAGAEEEAQKGGVEFEGEFDAERAKRAIENARAEEKRLKARLAEKDEVLAKYQAAEEQKQEAEKSLEQKVAERDAQIRDLKDEIKTIRVKNSFVTEAAKRGYEDPHLAFVAAREEGLLGKYDPKTGDVGDHDFEALEESHPRFAAEAGRAGDHATGDAGVRSFGGTDDVGATFNKELRAAFGQR